MTFDWLKTFFRSRYVLWLEDEVERLRQENRSMMNSLLVRAGVQPVDTPKPAPRLNRRLTRHQQQVQFEREWVNGAPKQPEAS